MHGPGAGIVGVLAERAVAAAVAAEVGDREEDLARVGDVAAFVSIAETARGFEQRGKLVVSTADQGVSVADGRGAAAIEHPRERAGE